MVRSGRSRQLFDGQAEPGLNALLTSVNRINAPHRLVVQLNSGIEVLGHGESRSISLKDVGIVAYDVSPDGTKILAASYVTEPTHYTREDQLLTIDTLSGERTTLVRASPTEDLGPALWSPDGGEVAYRLSTLSVDPATEHPG